MNDTEFSPEILISMIMTITGIITAIVGIKALKQSEKNLKIQLFYEDRKKAIFELNKILKNSEYFSTKYQLINFLELPESQYLPPNIRKNILSKIKEIDELIKEKGYDKVLEQAQPTMSGEEELELMEKEMIRQQDPEEWVEDRLEKKFTSFKTDIKNESQKKLKDLND